MDNHHSSKNQQNTEKAYAFAYEVVGTMVTALVALALVFCFAFRMVSVDGNSMKSTLENEDRLLLVHPYSAPKHGDIVVVARDNNEPLIKRVIACGGDTIVIREGVVILNGSRLDEPYLDKACLLEGKLTPPYDLTTEVTVPAGCYIVMGDNRMDSYDSRYAGIGFVELKDIMGKAIWRIWPTEKFGAVD